MIIPIKRDKIIDNKYSFKREIPSGLKVEVRIHDKVDKDSVLASGETSEDKVRIDVSSKLGIKPQDSKKYLQCIEGEKVSKGDIIVLRKKRFMKREQSIEALSSGVIDLSEINSGILKILDTAKPKTINAGVDGEVVSVIRNNKVNILCEVFRLKPFRIFGKSVQAELFYMEKSKSNIEIGPNLKDGVVVLGFIPGFDFLRQLAMTGVLGIITGSISSSYLKEIKSDGLWGMTLCLLEGFGNIDIDKRLVDVFVQNDGYLCFLNSKDKELILTKTGGKVSNDNERLVKRVEKGDRVKLLDLQHWGQYGDVEETFDQYVKVQTDNKETLEIDVKNILLS